MDGLFDDDPAPIRPAKRGGQLPIKRTASEPAESADAGISSPMPMQDKPTKTPPKPAGRGAPANTLSTSHPPSATVGNTSTGTPTIRTVAEVNSLIQRALAAQLPTTLLVQGELSNFSVYGKGHAFFKLKDSTAEIACMMWRDTLERLRFKPQDGLAVLAEGSIKFYEPQGRLNFYVSRLTPQGAGTLELAFRQLCEKLRAEGLFATQRKRSIPLFPQRVVIITSPTGDVIHDVLATAWRRYPGLHIMVYPVQVQGSVAAGQIVRAIELVNANAGELKVDLILLVRGGGSLEDLWAFNEEIVARAIVASTVPIATGIGHEPDTTIADLVADLRGPTPTGVTELTIPDARTLRKECAAIANNLRHDIQNRLLHGDKDLNAAAASLANSLRGLVRRGQKRVDGVMALLARVEPKHAVAQGWRRLEETQRQLKTSPLRELRLCSQRLAGMESRLQRASPLIVLTQCKTRLAPAGTVLFHAMKTALQIRQNSLEAGLRQLQLIGPVAVLKRGYSITTDSHGQVLVSVSRIQPGENIKTRLADGEISSENVTVIRQCP